MCTRETASNLLRKLENVLPATQAASRTTHLDSNDLVAQVFNCASDYCQSNNIAHQAMSQVLAYLERRNLVPKGTVRTWHNEGRYALECDSPRSRSSSLHATEEAI